jgi:hypothetical protein
MRIHPAYQPGRLPGTFREPKLQGVLISSGFSRDVGGAQDHGKDARLFRPLNPISGQTDFRVAGPLRRKDNSSLGPRRRLRVWLRCRVKPTSLCWDLDQLPFRHTGRECPFETDLPYGSGPTDPRPTAVRMEPFSTLVLQVLIEVFATVRADGLSVDNLCLLR